MGYCCPHKMFFMHFPGNFCDWGILWIAVPGTKSSWSSTGSTSRAPLATKPKCEVRRKKCIKTAQTVSMLLWHLENSLCQCSVLLSVCFLCGPVKGGTFTSGFTDCGLWWNAINHHQNQTKHSPLALLGFASSETFNWSRFLQEMSSQLP